MTEIPSKWHKAKQKAKRGFREVRGRIEKPVRRFGYHSQPQFLIIGAQKSGTTTLFYWLWQHSYIVRPYIKEISFFDKDQNYAKGLDWYHSHFPILYPWCPKVTFEATPEYLYHQQVPERLHSYAPHLKLIVVLRDPVLRAYSAWNMRATRTVAKRPNSAEAEYRDFDVAVMHEIEGMENGTLPLHPAYVRRGLYAEQLERYFDYFAGDQVLVINSLRMFQDPASVLADVLQFLALPPHEWSSDSLGTIRVEGNYEGKMSAEIQSMLKEFYRPHNERLYALLGEDFGWG